MAGGLEVVLTGATWPRERIKGLEGDLKLCPRCKRELETMEHRTWLYPCNDEIPELRHEPQHFERQAGAAAASTPCFWHRALVPSEWTETAPPPATEEVSEAGEPCVGDRMRTIYGDASGGPHSACPRRRRVAWAIVELEPAEAEAGVAPQELPQCCWTKTSRLAGPRQTVNRGELRCLEAAIQSCTEATSNLRFVTDSILGLRGVERRRPRWKRQHWREGGDLARDVSGDDPRAREDAAPLNLRLVGGARAPRPTTLQAQKEESQRQGELEAKHPRRSAPPASSSRPSGTKSRRICPRSRGPRCTLRARRSGRHGGDTGDGTVKPPWEVEARADGKGAREEHRKRIAAVAESSLAKTRTQVGPPPSRRDDLDHVGPREAGVGEDGGRAPAVLEHPTTDTGVSGPLQGLAMSCGTEGHPRLRAGPRGAPESFGDGHAGELGETSDMVGVADGDPSPADRGRDGSQRQGGPR